MIPFPGQFPRVAGKREGINPSHTNKNVGEGFIPAVRVFHKENVGEGFTPVRVFHKENVGAGFIPARVFPSFAGASRVSRELKIQVPGSGRSDLGARSVLHRPSSLTLDGVLNVV
jgi:hypothetical protein